MAQPTSTTDQTHAADARTNRPTTPVRRGAGIVGAVFLLVGVAGFIPGITQNLGDITWVGHESEAELLGLFRVNILHNLVHLAFGVLGLWAATKSSSVSKGYLIGGGIVYLALWLYGLVIDLDSEANFVSLNNADNWLHLGLGAGMILLGVVLSGPRDERDARRA